MKHFIKKKVAYEGSQVGIGGAIIQERCSIT